MENEIIDLLDRHYNAFINDSDGWQFLSGLADYLEFIDETQVIKSILEGRGNKEFSEKCDLLKFETSVLDPKKSGLSDKMISILHQTLSVKKDYVRRETIRLHNFLIKELKTPKVKTVSFDPEKSKLFVNGKEMPIQKFSKQYDLLRVIFEDKSRDWQFSEIGEKIDMAKPPSSKKLYNRADAIKKKVLIEAGVKDLFVTTVQSIKINNEYLGGG